MSLLDRIFRPVRSKVFPGIQPSRPPATHASPEKNEKSGHHAAVWSRRARRPRPSAGTTGRQMKGWGDMRVALKAIILEVIRRSVL